ncbi:probable purine permease 4 [Vigna unguiculata]|uniref:Probable purine permease n=1 Tax=Vigna unguiculata TaxID=3917 RepID=A0A4D6LBX4_VIGUN|nr:probable purine permease 4 [Vigna unguiculata]QCD85906.1 Purine permease [Vigna unguiculata]
MATTLPSATLQHHSVANPQQNATNNAETEIVYVEESLPNHSSAVENKEKNKEENNDENNDEDEKSTTNKRYMPLLILNYVLLFVGSLSASLLSKYYFVHRGSSKWVSTWVQSGGFPLLLFPIFLPVLLKSTKRKPFSDFNQKMFLFSILVGLMLGFNNLLISWGVAYLPVSTSALLLSTQLVFTLILSSLIVKQKITFTNLNCVILITISSIILALDSSHEKPLGLTNKNYFIGFSCTIGASLLFALYLPVMEKIYQRVNCYQMVMEMQLIMEIAATVLATVGMACDGGFSDMKKEAERVFDKGTAVYWVTILSTVVTWQCCFMGTAGMVFLTSSLNGGICSTALLSINVLGGVVVYKDAFGGFKAVSTVLCIWGFCSYVFGMYIKMKKNKVGRKNNNNGPSTELIPRRNSGGIS